MSYRAHTGCNLTHLRYAPWGGDTRPGRGGSFFERGESRESLEAPRPFRVERARHRGLDETGAAAHDSAVVAPHRAGAAHQSQPGADLPPAQSQRGHEELVAVQRRMRAGMNRREAEARAPISNIVRDRRRLRMLHAVGGDEIDQALQRRRHVARLPSRGRSGAIDDEIDDVIQRYDLREVGAAHAVSYRVAPGESAGSFGADSPPSGESSSRDE